MSDSVLSLAEYTYEIVYACQLPIILYSPAWLMRPGRKPAMTGIYIRDCLAVFCRGSSEIYISPLCYFDGHEILVVILFPVYPSENYYSASTVYKAIPVDKWKLIANIRHNFRHFRRH